MKPIKLQIDERNWDFKKNMWTNSWIGSDILMECFENAVDFKT